jgi:uncharacterized delta-60 repeat protein
MIGRRRICFVLVITLALTIGASQVADAFFGEPDPSFGGTGKVTTDNGANDQLLDAARQSDGKIVAVGRTDSIPGTGLNNDFAVLRYNTDGSLDSSFGGGDGIVTTAIGAGNADDIAAAVAIQADGKIVVAGEADMGATGTDFAVVRYDTSGIPDTATFGGGDGIVTTPIGPGANDDFASGVAIRSSDNFIVVSGGADMGSTTDNDFAVVRYKTDGVLDVGGFGGGIQTTDFTGDTNDDFGIEVALQADGKTVVSGQATNNSSGEGDFALARYNTDGTLDTNTDADPLIHFDTDGKVVTSFGIHSAGTRGLAIQGDGKIVTAGFAGGGPPTGQDFALARYNPNDGSLDASFDGDSGAGNGMIRVPVAPDGLSDFGQDLQLQGDGQIVVVGFADENGDQSFAVARLNGSNGTLDPVLGGDGTVTTSFAPPGVADVGRGLTLQPDGKIVVVGEAGVGPNPNDFAIARLGPDVSVPETTITSGPSGPTTNHTATFTFTSSEPGSFQCKLDSAGFGPCSGGSSHTVSVGDGAHTFQVAATDGFGHTDASPAQASFTVSTPVPGPTGQRAAALKKCKKKKSAAARRKCKRRAKRLPI